MAKTPIKYIDGSFVPDWLIDLFGRLKVSSPVSQISINQSSATNQLVSSEGQVSGTETSSTYNHQKASTDIAVGTSVGLRRFRSSISGIYQPGKPLLTFQTFTLGTGQVNVIKRIGYFWQNNGIYLEQSGTQLNIVKRSGVTGTAIETRIAQNDWNQDPFDGTKAGYNLDPTKSHILFIAFEWLGVGDVVIGFIKDRTPIVAHVFSHPNQNSGAYMGSPNLFLTWEIERISAGGTPSLLEVICGSLQIEGGLDSIGTTYTIFRSLNQTFSITGTNIFRVLTLFRLKPNSINSRVKFLNVELIIQDSCVYQVALVKRPNIVGTYTPTWIDHTDSSTQYWHNDVTGLEVTNTENNNIWMSTGTSTNRGFSNVQSTTGTVDSFSSQFDDTPDLYALVIATNSNNVNVLSTLITLEEQL